MDGFISFDDALRVTRCSPKTLTERLRRLGIPVFRDPYDHRRRLVREDDFNHLMNPIVVSGGSIEEVGIEPHAA